MYHPQEGRGHRSPGKTSFISRGDRASDLRSPYLSHHRNLRYC
ncbi:MAG: hypothetical protein QNJ54_29520 [Prochloraceae cyanobacterium]|nr:hypothetical protein [Prochloraceae cyanobacterium]